MQSNDTKKIKQEMAKIRFSWYKVYILDTETTCEYYEITV